MAFPALADPQRTPIHVLFPESYEASRREVARDFVMFGLLIVGGIVFLAMLDLSIQTQL